jgi:hypothetical protein
MLLIHAAGFFASIPDCRACDSPRTVHPECMPISVPPGDHYYPQVNHTTGDHLCFSFMRSLPGQQHLGKWKLSSVYVISGSEITFFHKLCIESNTFFVANYERQSETKFAILKWYSDRVLKTAQYLPCTLRFIAPLMLIA